MKQRVTPHDVQSENSLIGAMLLSKEAVAVAVETLNGAEDFYQPALGHIYEAIIGLYGAGDPIDLTSVADALRRAGLADAIGGEARLTALQSATPASTGARHYAKIVEEYALLRRMISVCAEISDDAYSVPQDVARLLDDAESKIFGVADRRLTDTTLHVSDVVTQVLDKTEERYASDNAITGVPTGYLDLDRILCGMQHGTLIVVGARPAMGKSAFATGIASHVAQTVGRPVLIFSMEMSSVELGSRMLCGAAQVDSTRLKTGQLSTGEWEKLHKAVGSLATAPIYIDDNPNITVMDIRAKSRRLKSRVGDLGLVVIDYIQLMNGRSRAENRQVEVAEISRHLKVLARELDAPIVALAQLNRGLEARADKRPMLSDLRESGSLEQDADVVLFLYRDEVYNAASEDRGTAEIIVAKHRQGPVGATRLAWLERFTKFANMAKGV